MNEGRAILADVVARLFTERVTRELRQSAETDVWPDALWAAVEENGLTLPLVPEAQGGAGSTWGDAHVVVSAAGRHAVPLPLPETIVAAWLLAGVGLDVPAGPLTLAPAQRDDDPPVRATTGGLRQHRTERRQFGKPIGAYQAIQQNLAVLAGHAAAADIAAAHAFRAADRGDAAFEIGVAKVRAGEAAGIGASIAHQVHGALGFTYEHDLQFVTRRLWAWRAEFGGEGWWATALGREVADWGADALWSTVTAR